MLKTEGSRGGGAEKRNRNYETVLPAGYREIFSVDCEDVKTILLLSAVSLYVGVVLIAAACLILNPFKAIEQYRQSDDFEAIFVTEDREVYVTEGLADKFALTSEYHDLPLHTIIK